MKIILIAPQSITKHAYDVEPFRFDYAFWNFYLPLIKLGHEVEFFDSSILGDIDLNRMIKRFKPDLLFCIMTGSTVYCPKEPWTTIRKETKKGDVKTFNWFCDDSWRFDGFSAEVCTSFHYCSTPEKRFVKKYKDIGYNNIVHATWHANSDVYSTLLNEERRHTFSFVGGRHGNRAEFIKTLQSKSFDVFSPSGSSFESMVWAYSSARAGLSFSQNSVNSKTQMKARMFEVPATGALLVTEQTKDLRYNYDLGEEIVVFSNKDELLEIAKDMDARPKKYRDIAERGHKRFKKDHDSTVRLRKLLKDIS